MLLLLKLINKFINKLRIIPIIWFGSLYQEPKILDYEENAILLCFLCDQEFFSVLKEDYEEEK